MDVKTPKILVCGLSSDEEMIEARESLLRAKKYAKSTINIFTHFRNPPPPTRWTK